MPQTCLFVMLLTAPEHDAKGQSITHTNEYNHLKPIFCKISQCDMIVALYAHIIFK